MVPVLGPSGPGSGPRSCWCDEQPPEHPYSSPSHPFLGRRGFTVLSHFTSSGDPTSTNVASACGMGPGGRHRKCSLLPLGNFNFHIFHPQSPHNQPTLSSLDISDWYSQLWWSFLELLKITIHILIQSPGLKKKKKGT